MWARNPNFQGLTPLTEEGSNMYPKMDSLSSEIHILAPSPASSCLGHLLLAKTPTQGSKMTSPSLQTLEIAEGFTQGSGSCNWWL